MNDRIKELEKQATTVVEGWSDEHGTTRYYELNREKFVKLIVRECADIALKSGNIANKNIAAKIESERIYHKIKEHFGV
jgi:hypothetical protein